MTREEAIKGLKVLAKDFSGYKPNEEMFDMAIKALEQLEPCENAVNIIKNASFTGSDGLDYVETLTALYAIKPANLIVMPMLGRKQEEYPRFRGCFIEDGKIAIYTRVGGGNRGCGYGEEELYKDPNFVSTYDDDFDSTYATYLFNVPEKWKQDFEKITSGKLSEVSDEYYEHVCEFYPLLAKEGLIKAIFREEQE